MNLPTGVIADVLCCQHYTALPLSQRGPDNLQVGSGNLLLRANRVDPAILSLEGFIELPYTLLDPQVRRNRRRGFQLLAQAGQLFTDSIEIIEALSRQFIATVSMPG